MLNTIHTLITEKSNFKLWLRETVLIPNTSTSLQTKSLSEAHLTGGQFLLDEQTLNIRIFDRKLTRRPTVSKEKDKVCSLRARIWGTVHRGNIFSYVSCGISADPKHKHNCKGHGGKKQWKYRAEYFSWMRFMYMILQLKYISKY
jgi:hypothetical protein